MTLYWWHCCRCGYETDNKPELSWAEADRDWHIDQNRTGQNRASQNHGGPWQSFELSISHYHFRHIEAGHLT